MSELQQDFNDYCKKVMGHTRTCPTNYNPYVDLNAMAKVVEKQLDKDFVHGIDKLTMYLQEGHSVDIKQAFRDFIISTMEDKK